MDWKQVTDEEKKKSYYPKLVEFVKNERLSKVIYPPKELTTRILKDLPLEDVKVVILGQDPYHDGNATGYAFECAREVSPSLAKINEAIYGNSFETNKNLSYLVRQGVMLLNVILTVERGKPKSHYEEGWEEYTAALIRAILKRNKPVVFLLWGKHAYNSFNLAAAGVNCIKINADGKEELEDPIVMDWEKTLVIAVDHPAYAAYSKKAWFFNDCFNRCNIFLKSHSLTPINWTNS